jgi:hypothetical protein
MDALVTKSLSNQGMFNSKSELIKLAVSSTARPVTSIIVAVALGNLTSLEIPQ